MRQASKAAKGLKGLSAGGLPAVAAFNKEQIPKLYGSKKEEQPRALRFAEAVANEMHFTEEERQTFLQFLTNKRTNKRR